MTLSHPIVFLVDVDNTLVDNDAIQQDLKDHLERTYGTAARDRYWRILEDLFVDPCERGKGIGRALIEAVYAHADARGCSRTYWMTQETNATARALYDKVAAKSAFVQYRRESRAERSLA